jgi:hypothetical protein
VTKFQGILLTFCFLSFLCSLVTVRLWWIRRIRKRINYAKVSFVSKRNAMFSLPNNILCRLLFIYRVDMEDIMDEVDTIKMQSS